MQMIVEESIHLITDAGYLGDGNNLQHRIE
jgi:hypothetical protein